MPTINIEDQKYSVLEKRAEEKGYDDVDKYIDHLLSQVVEKIANEKNSSQQDEEVKEKLKELGYM